MLIVVDVLGIRLCWFETGNAGSQYWAMGAHNNVLEVRNHRKRSGMEGMEADSSMI